MLKREEILSTLGLARENVPVEEWGGEVIVSEMSGSARDAWEQSIRERDREGKLVSPRAKLVVFSVVDEEGNRLFRDDDVAAIGKLSSKAIEKICTVAMRLNGLAETSVDEAKKN